ncbi:MAG: outer membrane protein assembly factor BamA [Bacteroidota bacterium]
MKRFFSLFFLAITLASVAWAQVTPQQEGKTYTLSGLEVEGADYTDKNLIISLSGLVIGDPVTIPGIQISDGIRRLWEKNIFSDIGVRADRIIGDKVFLVITVKERPRISQFSFQGISKANADELREKINFIRGTILTEAKRQSAKRIIRNFYIEKGFYNTSIDIEEKPDKILKNGVTVNLNITKGKRIRVRYIDVEGNEAFTENKVKRKLKKFNERKWWRVWARSKYVPKQYREAKAALITAYQDLGYRDAIVAYDTVFSYDQENVVVKLKVYEGQQYFHRDIAWSGNYQYNSEVLQEVLAIKQGDVYSKSKVDQRLFGDPNGGDVSSLYLDNGYLFFKLEPVEVAVEGDSIDLEMRVVEGPQASIRSVPLSGNTKTSDFVVYREIRTAPGQKFSRSDIIRSQREILALNYFDQEKLGVVPTPNPTTGTVDIAYTVEERPADQLQLQGGWGQRFRDPTTGEVLFGGFVGTVQLGFNNFASRRMFEPGAWRPVPSGDGQRVSLAFQMNGRTYKNFSASFIEPWLGGKRPNSLGISASYFVIQQGSQSNAVSFYRNAITNLSVDYGRRLTFPDDFFTSRTSIAYKFYNILNPSRIFNGFQDDDEAQINIFTFRQSFDRSSVDAPIYPRSGSTMSLSVEATPPYSLFRADNSDFPNQTSAEKFRFLEYHKWRFNANWFLRITGNFVLSAKVEAGFLGSYNQDIGIPPFERFFLGGAGIGALGFNNFDGREIIPLRGYDNQTLVNGSPGNPRGQGYPIYNRMILEFRYPISLSQSTPIWVQAFLEGGNGYATFREYSPFKIRRAGGFGLRAMLPMVGLLGLDWAYGFDEANDIDLAPGISGNQFHFIIGQQF